MLAKNEEIIFHLAFLLEASTRESLSSWFWTFNGNYWLAHPRSLIRAFVTIHLSDSVSKLAASEILSSS